MLRIVATSDLHGNLPGIPPCDLLLICGDICPEIPVLMQARWLNTTFRDWLKKIPAKEIVGIAGNHDLIFEQAEYLVPVGLNWNYLKDSMIQLLGFNIYGTPWQLPFWGAFNLDDERLAIQYSKIPNNIDIFMSHSPPYGILDEVLTHPSKKGDDSFRHTGSVSLRQKVFEIQPKLFVCGHIHSSFGIDKQDKIIFANVSLLNDEMEAVNPPVIFDL